MNITYDEMKIPTKTIKTTYKGIQDLRRPNNKRPLFIKQELVVGAIETEIKCLQAVEAMYTYAQPRAFCIMNHRVIPMLRG